MPTDKIVAAAIKAQNETFRAFAEMVEMLRPALEGPANAPLDALGQVMASLAHPPRTDELMEGYALEIEVLRTFEIHGEGLRPFDPKSPARAGDVLVGSDRSLWIVAAVDEEGRITQVTGAPRAGAERQILYAWRPSAAERAWLLPGHVASPAYADLGKAMTHLVRLWGELDAGGRTYENPVLLFLEILRAPGLDLGTDDLAEIDEDRDLVAFCEPRGGLQPFAAGASVAPGDVIRLGQRGRWGLITRTAPDVVAFDVIVGGLGRKGALGEPADALQCLRDYAPQQLDAFWKPSAQ